jgi:hypothetical protein
MAAFTGALFLAMLIGAIQRLASEQTVDEGDDEEMEQWEKDYWNSPHMRH